MGDPPGELTLPALLVGTVPGLGLVTGVAVVSDGIAWTLIIEIVFYGVCLLAFRSLTRRWWAPLLVAAGAVLVQVTVPAPTQILGSALGGATYVLLLACPFLPYMLVGVVLSAASRGHLDRPAAAGCVVALLAVHTVLLSTSSILVTSLTYRLTFLGAALVFVALWAFAGRWGGSRVTSALADVSYPLYVVHPVLGYALIATLTSRDVPAAVAVLAAALAALGAAWVLHRTVEVPTHRVGRRWARRLSPQPSGPPPERVTAEATAAS